jgi:hypothetical protein
MQDVLPADVLLHSEVVVVIDKPSASTQAAQGLKPCSVSSRKFDWTIAMSIAIDADAQRISQALTVPEYLEAWISMPGQQKDSSIRASHMPNGYRLDHYRAGCIVTSVAGSFLFCHLRKMRLSWRMIDRPELPASVVDLRIRGNFGTSVLQLRHAALQCTGEFFWYQQLWLFSLHRLSCLLRCPWVF